VPWRVIPARRRVCVDPPDPPTFHSSGPGGQLPPWGQGAASVAPAGTRLPCGLVPGRGCPSHLSSSARHVQSYPEPASVAAAQTDLDTAVFDGYVSKGSKTAIQDQVEKSLKQMQGLLNSEHRDHINQSTDRKGKESEIEKFVRERAAASGAAAGANDEDEDGPAVQQAREAVAHRLARSHPPHARTDHGPLHWSSRDTDLATWGSRSP
jgi:hypothetical protein